MHIRQLSRRRRRTIRMAGLAATAAVAAGLTAGTPTDAGAAAPGDRAGSGGTITYVKGHDVYVARQDGTDARRVTTNGTAANPWRSPTSSDEGDLVAGRGDLIYRMDQWGTVLSTIDPPDLQDSAGQELGGPPAHLAVSPDGSKIAYTYEKYSCPIGLACKVRYVTAFTASDRLTDWRDWGVTFYDNPSWITNTRVAVNDDLIDNINLFDLAKGETFWFDEDDYTTDDHPLFDFEVSRNAPYATAVRDTGENADVVFYRLSGNYRNGGRPPIPTGLCSTSSVLGIASPTWSADGELAAWQEPDGVWTVAMGSEPCQAQPVLAIPGATSPSFSAAPLQTSRPTYPALEVRAKPRVSGSPKAGSTLKASGGTFSPEPTAVARQWLRDGKPVPGATRATYRVSKRDRGHALSVRVTATRDGYRATVATSAPVRVAK